MQNNKELRKKKRAKKQPGKQLRRKRAKKRLLKKQRRKKPDVLQLKEQRQKKKRVKKPTEKQLLPVNKGHQNLLPSPSKSRFKNLLLLQPEPQQVLQFILLVWCVRCMVDMLRHGMDGEPTRFSKPKNSTLERILEEADQSKLQKPEPLFVQGIIMAGDTM